MDWSFTILIILVIIISIIIIGLNDNHYDNYEKASWTNNVRVLGLLAAISLVLLGYACQIGSIDNKLLYPLLSLTLVFLLIWIVSLVSLCFLSLACFTSWIIFILTLTIVIILGQNKEKSILFIALPFLFISMISLFISHDIINKNHEHPDYLI